MFHLNYATLQNQNAAYCRHYPLEVPNTPVSDQDGDTAGESTCTYSSCNVLIICLSAHLSGWEHIIQKWISSKQETLSQCWLNVGPALWMVGQYWVQVVCLLGCRLHSWFSTALTKIIGLLFYHIVYVNPPVFSEQRYRLKFIECADAYLNSSRNCKRAGVFHSFTASSELKMSRRNTALKYSAEHCPYWILSWPMQCFFALLLSQWLVVTVTSSLPPTVASGQVCMFFFDDVISCLCMCSFSHRTKCFLHNCIIHMDVFYYILWLENSQLWEWNVLIRQ